MNGREREKKQCSGQKSKVKLEIVYHVLKIFCSFPHKPFPAAPSELGLTGVDSFHMMDATMKKRGRCHEPQAESARNTLFMIRTAENSRFQS